MKTQAIWYSFCLVLITWGCQTETSTHQNQTRKENMEDVLEQKTDPPLTVEGKPLEAFIPDGYVLLDSLLGDLNLDAYEDMIAIVKQKDEQEVSDNQEEPVARPLLILTGQEKEGFKLAARSDQTVLCNTCGGVFGDPYDGLAIKNGYFSVEHYGGSGWKWTRIVTYKYDPSEKNWFLHKDGGDYFHSGDPENVETKVRTVKDFGNVPFKDFNIYDEY